MPRKKIVALKTEAAQAISLSNFVALQGVSVDRDSGLIKNVAIISQGPAMGHGFDVDETMTRQVRDFAKKQKTKSHFTHSHAQGGFFVPATDGLGTQIGHLVPGSVRIENGTVRGDIQLSKASANQPGMGNIRAFLLDMAEESPDSFGLSIVFEPDDFEERRDVNNQSLPPAGRVKRLTAVDFVEDPGANPNGLLSKAVSTPKENEMTKELRAYLESIGLSKDATDEQALAFAKGLKKPEEIEAAKVLAKVELATEIGKAVSLAAGAGQQTIAKPEPTQADKDAAVLAKIDSDTQMYTSLARVAKLDETGTQAFIAKHLDAGSDAEAAKKDALSILQSKFANPGIKTHATVITGGANLDLDTLAAGMEDAIMLRSGHKKLVKLDSSGNVVFGADGKPETRAPHERALKWRGLSVTEMIRVYLAKLGVHDAMELSKVRLAELIGPRAFRKAYPDAYALAQSTSDFSSILENVMTKTLRQAYLDAPRTWEIWARRATAPDFKNINRAALSEVPNLTSITEGQGVNYVTLSDSKETYALAEYNGGILLTRRAIINDDLDAFNRIPMLQAMAAGRKEEDVAYSILTANAAMSDGENLFSAAHANHTSSGGAPPSTVAGLNTTYIKMRKQKGPKAAARLDLRPKFLIVPVALEVGTQQFISSAVDPSKSNSTPNPFANTMTVVSNVRLDDSSAKEWYMAADYRDGQVDTVEVCFLEDEPMPVLKQETDFDTEDVKFKVRHTVAAKAIDFRGLAKDKGEN